jgi:arylsulfatase A
MRICCEKAMKLFNAIGFVCAFIVLSGSLLAQENTRPPNIILIMADDLGYGELGCYGQEKIRTPNIDRLAAEGMKFTQHYTSAPVCAPARCSLMTGLHGGHALVRDNFEVGEWDSFRGQYPLPDGTQTIASVLKSQGYKTSAFGKWGLGEVGSTGDPLNQGFDRFYGYNCQRHAHNYYPRYLVDDDKKQMLDGNNRGVTGKQYAPQLIADQMLKFIEENKDEPFFVYYPTVIPHLALQVPDEEMKQYAGQWEETAYKGSSYQPHETPRAAYAAMISFMDRQVGRLLETLDKNGIAENTIILFTSDNGPTHVSKQVDAAFFKSAANLRGLKGSVYEGGIRIPLIVWWPGNVAANSKSELISAHYDLLPTIAEIGGAQLTDRTDGISFVDEIKGHSSQKKHEFLFWDFAGYGGQIAIRKGDWKAIKQDVKKNAEVAWQLYNLAIDPTESTNVANQHPDLITQFQRIMLEQREKPTIERFEFGEYD